MDEADTEIVQSVDVGEIETRNYIGTMNGNRLETKRHHYVITENALKYPRLLLDRITQNKRKNEKLCDEIAVLRKKYFKLQMATKLKKIPTNRSIETIDIS